MVFNQEEFIKLIAQNLNVPEASVTPESSFKEDLGADSLDLVEMAILIEEKYGVSIPDGDADKFIKVRDVINYLEKAVK